MDPRILEETADELMLLAANKRYQAEDLNRRADDLIDQASGANDLKRQADDLLREAADDDILAEANLVEAKRLRDELKDADSIERAAEAAVRNG